MADEPSPALTATADQHAAYLTEMARCLGSYYRGLVSSGIPAEQAGELTNAYAEEYWKVALHKCCPCQQWPDING